MSDEEEMLFDNCPNISSSPIEFDKLFPNCARLVSSKDSDETEVDEAIKCITVEDIGREYGIESEVNIVTSSFVPDHTRARARIVIFYHIINFPSQLDEEK